MLILRTPLGIVNKTFNDNDNRKTIQTIEYDLLKKCQGKCFLK